MLLLSKKRNAITSFRKKILEHLRDLEKGNQIDWVGHTTRAYYNSSRETTEKEITLEGCAGDLTITIKYIFRPTQMVGYGMYHQQTLFQSINVSLKGNGILKLDKETVPKHRYWTLDPCITFLIKRAHEAVISNGTQMRRSLEQDAEQSAHEILSHLAAT